MQHLEMWKFLAGLGFFLFGITQLESVLKTLSGRSLKLFLKRNTKNLFKAITGGAVITGIIQSSSVVSLIVLAFVESGIITFRNALGIILGTNLGTTLSSWIFATVGFKLDVQDFSLPIIAITTILMFFLEKRKKLYNLLSIFFAMGILFLGLGLMKEGAMALVADFDMQSFSQYGTFVFIMVGFILTTIIQSSSATVAITLTAIYSGLLTFPAAAAIVIGSEVGTTIKILLWGMKGTADKKRVAWGNFIYNIFTAVVALITLNWLIYFIEHTLHITDALIGLVTFQTAINIISIVLFIPFLNVFANWMENKFTAASDNINSYISPNLPLLPILAADALKLEALILFKKTLLFNKNILCYENTSNEGIIQNIRSFATTYTDIEIDYNRLKHTEGDIIGYFATIQENNLDKEDAMLMLQYVNAGRHSIYAAKSIKDIAHDIKNFEASSNDIKYRQRETIRNEWISFQDSLNKLVNLTATEKNNESITDLLKNALLQEEIEKSAVIQQLKNDQVNEVEASTIMNVHREILASKKSLLLALKNLISEADVK